MRKLLFVFLILSVSIWSCSDEEPTDDNNGDQVIEKVQKENVSEPKNEEEKVEEKQVPSLDAAFSSFLTKFKKVNLPYSLDPQKDDVSAKISVDNQIKYLAKAEDLDKEDFEEMKDYTDFFFVSKPIQAEDFSAVVYARFEMGSTYYFLCTYDNDGELISHIDFAAYELIGAGPQAGQEYNTKGKIAEDLSVTITSDEETAKYQIKDNGEIAEK